MKALNYADIHKTIAQTMAETFEYEKIDAAEQVRIEAVKVYNEAKRAKQREMEMGWSKGVSKQTRKRIDNNCSAVASRVKTRYLKRIYPAVLRKVSNNAVALAHYVQLLNQEVLTLKKELDATSKVVEQQKKHPRVAENVGHSLVRAPWEDPHIISSLTSPAASNKILEPSEVHWHASISELNALEEEVRKSL